MALRLNIAQDFSPVPIGRYRTDGNKSGEVFREELLYPRIRSALDKGESLEVDFTGMMGLNASFLEEAFGGLVREHDDLTSEKILQAIKFLPENSYFDTYIEVTKEYIQEATFRGSHTLSR